MAADQSQIRNRLLALIPPEEFSLIAGLLETIRLDRGMSIVAADGPIDHLYFFESGVGSIIVTSPEGLECEGGLFGRDGVAPTAALLGSDRAPHRINV